MNADLYVQYFKIRQRSYTERVKFFEDHVRELNYLPASQALEMRIDYLLSLFEIGRYDRYILTSDPIIEDVIGCNMIEYEGVRIFEKLLLQKACAYLQIKRPLKAEPILASLIKMKADNKLVHSLYNTSVRQRIGRENVVFKGIAAFLVMCGLSLKFLSLFVVDAFYNEYMSIFGLSIVLSLVGALCSYSYFEWKVRAAVHKEVKGLQNR